MCLSKWISKCPHLEAFLTPFRQLALILLISGGVLVSAYVLQNFFGVRPCQLCLIERYFYMATGSLAFFGLVGAKPSQRHFLFLGIGFLFLLGGGVALYHSAIQYGVLPAPAFCAPADFGDDLSLEAMKAAILATPAVKCNEITWSFLGLSLAVYNTLLSFALSIYSFFLFRRFRGKS